MLDTSSGQCSSSRGTGTGTSGKGKFYVSLSHFSTLNTAQLRNCNTRHLCFPKRASMLKKENVTGVGYLYHYLEYHISLRCLSFTFMIFRPSEISSSSLLKGFPSIVRSKGIKRQRYFSESSCLLDGIDDTKCTHIGILFVVACPPVAQIRQMVSLKDSLCMNA